MRNGRKAYTLANGIDGFCGVVATTISIPGYNRSEQQDEVEEEEEEGKPQEEEDDDGVNRTAARKKKKLRTIF